MTSTRTWWLGPWAAAILVSAQAGSTACSDDETAAAGGTTVTTNTGAGNSGGSAAGGTTGTGGSAPGGGSAQGGAGGAAPVTVCSGNCRYVREGASGSADGSDWTNAWTELPSTLERGHVYFLAAGTYAGYGFDDAPSGTEVIRVLRATTTDHGTDTGWQDGYASGTADLGPLTFDAPYVELDGRGATTVIGDFQGTVVDITGSHVTVRRCDLDGNFQQSGSNNHTDGSCTGVTISADDVTLADNAVHDAADDGIVVTNASRVSVVGNRLYTLHGCGTDGGCGPCYNGHSDGFEIYNVEDSEFSGNLVYDIASTSTFFFGNWADELGNGSSDYCANITLANNILYNPQTGFVIYIQDVAGVNLFNNVIWGQRSGAYGGLSIGDNVTDLELYNNVILSINYTHIGASYDASEHRGDYNLFGISLGQYPDQAHDIVHADPGFSAIGDIDAAEKDSPVAADFIPTGSSPLRDSGYAGDSTIVIPPLDYFGDARDSSPNIGAIEQVGGS